MSGFLLDTNCISEIVRPQPDAKVSAWMKAADENHLHLSVLALGEIRKGATLLPPGAKRAQLEHWLVVDLPARFQGRVLPVNDRVADRWGAITGQARSKGVTVPIIDGLMAATALEHGLTLVTRNVKDFEAVGVAVLDPWNAS